MEGTCPTDTGRWWSTARISRATGRPTWGRS